MVFYILIHDNLIFAGNSAKRQKTCDNPPGPINSPPMNRGGGFPALPVPVSMSSGNPQDNTKSSNPNTPMLGRSNSSGNINNSSMLTSLCISIRQFS